jgi:hypothetical protein
MPTRHSGDHTWIAGDDLSDGPAQNIAYWLAQIGFVSGAQLNVANTFTQPQTLPVIDKGGQVFNVLAYGNVTTDASAAMTAAHTAAAAVGGGIVEWPSGTFKIVTGATLSGNNVTHRGSGQKATVLQMQTSASSVPIINFTTTSNVAFEDMGFDWQRGVGGDVRATTTHGFDATNTIRARFTRCWFYRMPNYTIVADSSSGGIIEDCLFQDAGQPWTNAFGLGSNTKNWRFRNNRCHYTGTGVLGAGGSGFGIAPNEDIQITGNRMDLGWWTAIAIASGSGATVSYTASVVTDTAANFNTSIGTLPGFANPFVRIMPVLATGSGGTVTYDPMSLTDSGASFNPATILRGHFIRTADGRFGVVANVEAGGTVIEVEEWLSDANRDFMAQPANGQAYTVYGIYIMVLSSNTNTTLTTSDGGTSSHMLDLNGVAVTPSANTRYEVFYVSSYPVYLQGFARNCLVSGNIFRRSFGDMIEGGTYNDEGVTFTDNILIDGSDVGFFLGGRKGKAHGNVAIHTGAIGCLVGASDSLVSGNHAVDCGWFRPQNGVAQFTIQGSRVQVIGNRAEKISSTQTFYGFGTSGSTDSVFFDGNSGVGNITADYANVSGTPTNTTFGWNYGVGWPDVAVSTQAANYTLVLADHGTVIRTTKATAQTVTVPTNASVPFAIGTVIEICQMGAGTVTLTAAGGVTINTPSSLTTRAQYSTVGIRQDAANVWIASGDLT